MAFQPLAFQDLAFQQDSTPPVEVPDVVGDAQAAGTAELEGEGFVVAVVTAYSDVVPAGTIISQSPTAGSFALPGATVTITVSLGAQSTAAGGWLFLNEWEAEKQRRKARERRRKKLEEETEQIEDKLDKQIAQLLRKQEAEDDEREGRKRLVGIAKAHADYEAAREYSERVAIALKRVIRQENYSAIKALERELKRAKEEEELLMIAVMTFSD